MKGGKVIFSLRREFSKTGLELPRGTILEVEVVPEMEREVRTRPQHHVMFIQGQSQLQQEVIYIVDVLTVYGEDIGSKPLKER